MLMYFASISPTPEITILVGDFLRMSVSPIIISAQREGSEIFTPSKVMDEVFEAYPSIDGAVATMI